MTIPWATALHLARKLLPVVIDKAPDLLKAFERYRPVSQTRDAAPSDPALAALQERIEAHEETIATQADVIRQLHSALSAAKRSARVAWSIFTVTVIMAGTMILYLLSRS